MRVVPQASNCREITVGGKTYARKPGALFDLPESAARHTIRYQGGQVPSLSGTTRKSTGYRCRSCGFGSSIRPIRPEAPAIAMFMAVMREI